MSDNGFRGAVFGGFNKEDVLRYIEQADAKYYEETEELKRKLSETQNALSEMREQNKTLTSKNAELLERLGELTLDTDKIRAQLEEIEKGFTSQTAEIEEQGMRVSLLAEENDRLTEENARLSAKCGEYDASKDKIAEMELSAYRRAKKIEEDTRDELQKLRRESLDMIERVKAQLDMTKENYRIMLSRNQKESEEMQRKAGEVLSEIDRISASLDGKKVKEKPRTGLRELNGVRTKMEG